MVRLTDMLQPGGQGRENQRREEPPQVLPELVILTRREEILTQVREAVEERGYRLHQATDVASVNERRKVAGDVLVVADRSLEGSEEYARAESAAGRPVLLLVEEAGEEVAGISATRVISRALDAESLKTRIEESLPSKPLSGGGGRRQVFTGTRQEGAPKPASTGRPMETPRTTPEPARPAAAVPGTPPASTAPSPAAPSPPPADRPAGPAPVPETAREPEPAGPSGSAGAKGTPGKSDIYDRACKACRAFLQAHRNRSHPPLTEIAHAVEDIVREVEESNDLYLAAIYHQPDFEDVDAYLAAHHVNTVIYSIKIAHGMKFAAKQVFEVALSAAVHDVGMTQLPEGLIGRRGKLDQSGYSMLKQHPEFGQQLLKPYARAYPWLPDVVHQEHERWDGSGYPAGLSGEAIHPYARVLGLADTYEALTHGRPFRERMIPFNVLQQLIRLGGRLFQSELVKGLIQEISVFPLGSFVRLNTGEVGKVTAINEGYPLRPIVRVTLSADGSALEEGRNIDLRSEPMLYITGPVEKES